MKPINLNLSVALMETIRETQRGIEEDIGNKSAGKIAEVKDLTAHPLIIRNVTGYHATIKMSSTKVIQFYGKMAKFFIFRC